MTVSQIVAAILTVESKGTTIEVLEDKVKLWVSLIHQKGRDVLGLSEVPNNYLRRAISLLGKKWSKRITLRLSTACINLMRRRNTV